MEYLDLKYSQYATEMYHQLEKGIFLTTKVDQKVNTMTIGWGGINFVWNKKVFVAYVRYSRDTFDMMEKSNEFTISVPLNGQLKKELAFCGTKSGRDVNKISECGLTLLDSRVINTPIIGECDLHYECKIIYKQAMEPGNILDSVKERFYSTNNYHVIYYGEIVDTYLLKGEK